ncbi:MAG: Diaminopimelate decarboxylase [Methanomassiliicoccales archaeon PtaU1.Bin124]|nr:MAG: Diaminopimelate decarboxylase [Methanomassiliicoccales archaeon PtaU1.Bin124]
MRNFESINGQMTIGGVKAVDIARKYGTPVYVTDEARLRENYRNVSAAFNSRMPTRINYALKANNNLAVLRILEKEGSCIDAVSIGEVELCLKAGFSPDRILYTGTSVSNEELSMLAARKVPINIDSMSEMRRLAEIAPGHPISIRVNPGVGAGHHAHVMTGSKTTKFGVPKGAIVNAYSEAISLGFNPFGIHCHIGAGVQVIDPFLEVTDVMIDIVNEIKDVLGLQLEMLDLGGGIGIPYKPEDHEMDLDAMADAITGRVLESTGIKQLVLEPGRYIICDSTVLLATVHDVKETPDKRFAGTDAGFHTLIRPAFYGSYHHVAVANRFGAPNELAYDVVGPICESGDFIAKDRKLPRLAEGDVLVIYDTGAYGFTMASNYNARPLPAEVLVSEGQTYLTRERQTMDDLIRGQKIPSRLMV